MLTDIRLKGERIVLRRLKSADAESIWKNVRDREISRFTLIPYPYRRHDAVSFIERAGTAMRTGKEFHLGIEHRETRTIIGVIGLQQCNLDHKRAEIGYWIGKEFWGQGLAAEGVRLMLQFSFSKLRLHRVYAYVETENDRSVRVLEKVGFSREGLLRGFLRKQGRQQDCFLYSMLRPEWENREQA